MEANEKECYVLLLKAMFLHKILMYFKSTEKLSSSYSGELENMLFQFCISSLSRKLIL